MGGPGKTIKLFGEELRLHDLWRVGGAAVPTENGHQVGGNAALNLQATDTTGMSLGIGVSSYMSADSKRVGGSANVMGPVFFGVWAGVEAEVLRDLNADKTQVGAAAGAFGILPSVEIPIYLKAGFMDVTELDSWAVTLGVSLSFEFLRAP